MKKLILSLLTTILLLSLSVPAFASENNKSQGEFEQFKIDLLEAELSGNDKLAEDYVSENPEFVAQYLKTDAFNSEKVNDKLKNSGLGPNGTVLLVMDDNSFVRVTTKTKPIVDESTPKKLTRDFSTNDYSREYDMSGTKWNTDYVYEVGRGVATLCLNTYYQIGSKMDIYAYDAGGTKGSVGVSVSHNLSLSGNKTATARVKGDYTLNYFGSNQHYTLYTEIGFLQAYLEADGYYYVDYYVDSWASA